MYNFKKIAAMIMTGLIMLAFAGCGKKTEEKGKGSSSKKTYESEEVETTSYSMSPEVSEAWDRINGNTPDGQEREGKSGPDFTLDQTGYMKPYTYMYPSTAKKPDMNKSTILISDEHFVFHPITFYAKYTEGQDFASMSMDEYIAFCEPILTGSDGISQAYGGIFRAHLDSAIYIKIESETPVEVNGHKACLVHGSWGDPQYFDETYFVACYVLDPTDPFVLWASPWVVNVSEHEWKPDEEAASPERLEAFLKQVLATVERNS